MKASTTVFEAPSLIVATLQLLAMAFKRCTSFARFAFRSEADGIAGFAAGCQSLLFSGLAAGCWSRLLFSGRAAGCYSWLCSSAGLGRVSLHCHLAQAPAVPHITHPRATLSKQPQYKKHGKTFEKQPGAPSGPEKFVPKLWEPFSNKLQQHLDHFRTTSNLQFLLLCWDFEPCSNRFEPGSNRMDSAIPMKLLGFRTVFEPRSNRVRTAFEPPGNAIPIKLVGFRTGVDETGGWDF